MFTFNLIPEIASALLIEAVATTWKLIPDAVGDLIFDGINKAEADDKYR